MKVYKYMVVKTQKEINEAKLNEFGRRGFELVSVTSDEFTYTYYFKTEVENA